VELFVDPNFFPRLTAKKEAIKDVELGLQVRHFMPPAATDLRALMTPSPALLSPASDLNSSSD
jgi:hypothetical protein